MKLRTYYLACREHTNNIASNKVVGDTSRCVQCLSDKS